MVKIEDIIFWIFIVIIIGTALWLLHGSPPEMNAIITIGLAVAGSELMLWRKIFSVDKNTSLGFMKVKHDMEKLRININNRFDKVDERFNGIDKRFNKIDERFDKLENRLIAMK